MPSFVYGPPFPFRTGGRYYQTSDSIGALDGDSQAIIMSIRRFFAIAKKNPRGPRPFHWNGGVSSTTIATAMQRFLIDYAKYAPLTGYIGIHGIFDCIGTGTPVGTAADTTNATMSGQFRQLLDLVTGLG